jgi:hypothetical protein
MKWGLSIKRSISQSLKRRLLGAVTATILLSNAAFAGVKDAFPQDETTIGARFVVESITTDGQAAVALYAGSDQQSAGVSSFEISFDLSSGADFLLVEKAPAISSWVEPLVVQSAESASFVIYGDSGSQLTEETHILSLSFDLDDGNQQITRYSGFINEMFYESGAPILLRMADDADGDFRSDANDAFPNDPLEWLDTDSDGVGNNADQDDDGDGSEDANDAYPLVSIGALTDTDGDGRPDDCEEMTPSPCWESGGGDSVTSTGNSYAIELDSFDGLKLRVHNVDTEFRVTVDGSLLDKVNRGADKVIDLGTVITSSSVANLDLYNYGDGYTYTWTLLRGGEELASETCGLNGFRGCDNNLYLDGLVKSWVLNFSLSRGARLMDSDTDDDGDGTEDQFDALPLDPSETSDTDGDGVGDNADAFPNDASESTDTDGDGVGDNADALPNDGSETTDSDGDGVGDNSDAFPEDDAETTDTDGDGVGDNADAFPDDASETVDTDGDGIGNNTDPDDDGDGIPDSSDAFPLDFTESLDTDADGVGNNTDTDDDGDGVDDASDPFPLDATESVDTDGDGIGNNADTDDDGDGVLDTNDAFPLDASETMDTDGDGVGNNADRDDDGDGFPDVAGLPVPTPILASGFTQSDYPGDDGDVQSGVAWNASRFTSNGDGTISDVLTGLTWVVDANCFGEQSWSSAVTSVRQLASGACGLSDGSEAGDWRLPNVNELMTLVVADTEAYRIAAPLSDVGDKNLFWTSTTQNLNGYIKGWAVLFNKLGRSTPGVSYSPLGSLLEDKVSLYSILAVKTGETGSRVLSTYQQASEIPGDDGDTTSGVVVSPRFVESGNGTFIDAATSLVWVVNGLCYESGYDLPWNGSSSRSLRWTQALDFAASLAEGTCGLTDGSTAGDWRVPNVRELQSLVMYPKDVNQPQKFLTNAPISSLTSMDGAIWTSTPSFAVDDVNDSTYRIRMEKSGYLVSVGKESRQPSLFVRSASNAEMLDLNYLTSADQFPLDASEWQDTDGDGIGNNADTDDDGDGVEDASDAFPLDASETVDTDVDGVGNNADTDDDGDGVDDGSDPFPLDATESVDTDGDGIGNNADTDDDGDGVEDASDAFPAGRL